MADAPGTRRQYLTIEAADGQGGVFFVHISHDRLLAVSSRSRGQIYEAAEIVPAVLRNPAAIFEGLCVDADESYRGVGWRCYSAIPDRSYTIDGVKRPPWEDKVFLVFVNDEKVAYNWRWEMCDLDDARLPQNHVDRFKKRIL